MYGQLQNGRTVASFLCTAVMRVGTGGRVCVSVEFNGLSFQHILPDDRIIRFVDSQYECEDTVATVLCCQCVSVDTGFGVCISFEFVTCTFTHGVADCVEHLLFDYDLQTVEVTLIIDGCIIAIESCPVILFFVAAPTVVPDVWQIVRTDGNNRIYRLMNNQLQNCRAVTSFRCTSSVSQSYAFA